MEKYGLRDFEKDFPADDDCLEWVKNLRWPEGIECPTCSQITSHYKITGRRAYACQVCGHHVYPMAGTVIEHSSTPLRLWFHAIFLMASTRCGISAKQLQRELGVTYKCAYRIFKQVRAMMNEDVMSLLGEIEVDETYIGGKRHGKRGRGAEGKTVVFGMAQRNGKIVASVVPDVKAKTLLPIIQEKVLSKSTIYSDELPSYNRLPKIGYDHKRVHHSAKIYVMASVHVNTLEGFWSLVKRGINGANHSVSAKCLQSYVNSYAFRWNHRKDETPMFLHLLSRLACPLRA